MKKFIIQYWLEMIFALICGIISFVFKKVYKKQKALEGGVVALLRSELIRCYREYKTKEEITILDKENFDLMYKEYKNLGGNGTITEMHEEVMRMNIKIIKG